MREPVPSRALLSSAVHAACRRGIPPADAEDVAVHAWERACSAWRRERGPFEPLFARVVQRAIADWWRTVGRRREVGTVPDLPTPLADADRIEAVSHNQERLLASLTSEERDLFATWVAQKRPPQGQLTAERAAASLGLDIKAYDNAKRRLKTRILTIAADLGLEPADLFSGADNEGPRRRRTHVQ